MIAPPAVESIPHAALGASALFRDLTDGEATALALYRWNPHDRADWAEAARIAAEAATARGTRDAVADRLRDQNRAWGASDEVLALVETLRQPDAAAVVTGQQLGLFAGPLYTIYKARTAVREAARLSDETGRPVVPVFWLADEDHDFAEIQTAAFAHGEEVRRCHYDDGRPADADRGAVGRIVLEADATQAALDQLADALPAGPGRDEALALARDAYVPGRTMRDAFALLLRALVPDIVLMSADDPVLKGLGRSLFQQEADRWPETLAALDERSAALRDAGYHVQVEPTPLNLFVLEEGARIPLDPDGDAVTLRGTGRTIGRDALAEQIQQSPETLSPNVVLRPLLQDTLLPTAAYVAGPGEAAYFAQLGPVYRLFGVPMPVIAPRLSLTIIEPSVGKVLDRYSLAVADLGGDPAALWRRLALDASDLDLEAAFAAAEATVVGALDALGASVTAVDASLDQALGAARARAVKALHRLEMKTVRLEKRNHDVVRQRLARARAALWPGAPQERVLGPLGVVARHGLGALPALVEAVPLDAFAHALVRP